VAVVVLAALKQQVLVSEFEGYPCMP
jgi:hypothetical protein